MMHPIFVTVLMLLSASVRVLVNVPHVNHAIFEYYIRRRRAVHQVPRRYVRDHGALRALLPGLWPFVSRTQGLDRQVRLSLCTCVSIFACTFTWCLQQEVQR